MQSHISHMHQNRGTLYLSPPMVLSRCPVARPGWFDINSVGGDGLPTSTSLWKFWTPEDPRYICGSVRSFVPSSVTCSLDLGVHVFARHPELMIRECYTAYKEPVPAAILPVWSSYQCHTHPRNDAALKNLFETFDISTLEQDYPDDHLYFHQVYATAAVALVSNLAREVFQSQSCLSVSCCFLL